jgi:hypothetical protein
MWVRFTDWLHCRCSGGGVELQAIEVLHALIAPALDALVRARSLHHEHFGRYLKSGCIVDRRQMQGAETLHLPF